MKIYLKRDSTKNWLFWWGTSPQAMRYPIPEKRVQASLDPEPKTLDEKLKAFREKMNALYRGSVKIAEFQGSYSREEKTLTLKA